MITLKINMPKTQDCYLQTLIKLKLEMAMKILAAIKKHLILVVIRLIKDTMMIQTNYSMAK